MNSPDADKWKDTCKEEYDTLMGYHTWTLVERPIGINVIGSCWTFRAKKDNLRQVTKYKARLVSQGYSQIPGLNFNETYSPTIQLMAIRLILAIACKYNLELRHMDVKGAYLNGMLEEEVYMRL